MDEITMEEERKTNKIAHENNIIPNKGWTTLNKVPQAIIAAKTLG